MTFDIKTGLYVWPIVIILCQIVYRMTRLTSVGLVYSYIVNLMVIHYFGALIYTFTWYVFPDYESVANGFEMSTYAVVFFGIGALLLPVAIKLFKFSLKPPKLVKPNNSLPLAYGISGVVFYYVLAPFLSKIPSFSTFVAAGWSLLIVSICLFTWRGWTQGNRKVLRWLLLSLILPVVSLIGKGLLSTGIAALTICFVFFGIFYRPRWKVWICALIVLYMSLSFYVTYMRDRNDLRDAIWYHEVSFIEKMQQFSWANRARDILGFIGNT